MYVCMYVNREAALAGKRAAAGCWLDLGCCCSAAQGVDDVSSSKRDAVVAQTRCRSRSHFCSLAAYGESTSPQLMTQTAFPVCS